jgi:beta-lactamase class A
LGRESAGIKSSGSQGVVVSESGDKLTAFSRRQPLNRRQRPRSGQKLEPKKVKVPGEQQRQRQKNNASPPPSAENKARKPKPGAITPTIKQTTTVRGKIPPFKPNAVPLKTVRVRKMPLPHQVMRSRRTRLKPMAKTLLYGLRLLIVGVGIGAIVGTLLSVLDPANRINTAGAQSNTDGQPQVQQTNTPTTGSGLYLSQEISTLKGTVQNLAAANPSLAPGVFLVDLDTGAYVDINAAASFPAASTIKFPILVAFFQEVDAGKIRLDETLTMQKDMVAGGSGDMQYKAVGSQFTVLEAATKMMTISDNTATNMMIARLGGIEALNQRFRTWGLTTTAIRNVLPDLQGTNTTSPKELGNLMAMVSKGNLVSMPSRDRLLDIMRRTVKDTLLPSGLGQGAIIAHKTGDIGTMLADTGLVDLPTGKRYIASVMVQRPNNDPRAEKLISSISRAAYQQFSQNTSTPNNTPGIIPQNGYQSPGISPPQPNTPGSIQPISGYQTPMINPALSNGIGNTIPIGGYQSPVINPNLPNGIGSTIPIGGYQSPMMNPQYYPPR